MPILKECLICSTVFKVKPSVHKKGGGKYCSQRCTAIAKHNKKEVECKYCNNTFSVHPSEVKRGGGIYCSRECYRKDIENVNRRVYSKKWRLEVFQRDNFSCVVCNNKGGELNAHHLNSYKDYPELREEPSNGVTLCGACHRDFHKEYGYIDFTEEDFYKYLASK